MNKAVSSRDEILEVCVKIVAKEGIASINMRNIADTCGIALGSLYNYFPSKSALLSLTIEAVWKDIFHQTSSSNNNDFVDYLTHLFENVKESSHRYPKFFSMHALSLPSNDKLDGRKLMDQYFMKIKEDLVQCLLHDARIRPNAFNDRFQPIDFADYIFKLFLSMQLEHDNNSESLLEFVRLYLY